jgi:hypothetical protein
MPESGCWSAEIFKNYASANVATKAELILASALFFGNVLRN